MRPSFKAVLWNDWPALAAWMGVLIVPLPSLGKWYLQRSGPPDPVLLALAAAAMLVLCIVLVWRVGRVARLFAGGAEVPGRITALMISGDRGRLAFAYEVDGTIRHAWSPVHKTRRVLAFVEQQPVRVLVNRADPDHALVAELFL